MINVQKQAVVKPCVILIWSFSVDRAKAVYKIRIYLQGEYFIWHPRFFHKTSLSIAVQKNVRLQDSERALCTRSHGKENQGFANAQKSHLTIATEYTSSIGIVFSFPWDPTESCHCGCSLMLKRRSCHQHQVIQFLFLLGAYLEVEVDLDRHNDRSRGAKPEAAALLLVLVSPVCSSVPNH